MTGALEADLQSEYGVDIAKFWRREIPYRKMVNYVVHLRQDSRVSQALSESPDGVSITDRLLVTLINEQRYYWHMWAKSKTEKGKQGPKEPDSIELPGPAPLSQSTKDKLEQGRQEAKKPKPEDFGTIADVHRFLSGL